MGVENIRFQESRGDSQFITIPPYELAPELKILSQDSFIMLVGGPIKKIDSFQANEKLVEKLHDLREASKRVFEANIHAIPNSSGTEYREEGLRHMQTYELILQDLQNGEISSSMQYLREEMVSNLANIVSAEQANHSSHPLIEASRNAVRTDIAIMLSLQNHVGE